MKLYTQDNEVKRIALAAFPNYAGKSFSVETFSPTRLDSCWEGGSRDFYRFVNLATLQTVGVPENGTPFSNGGQILKCDVLPFNVAMVRHTVFCGKDLGLTVHVGAENLGKYLPAPVELTLAQRIVLVTTRERKSSYNGQNRQQMAEADCGLPEPEWTKAKAELIAKGLLKANGSITDDGRNAAGTAQLWTLKWITP